MTTKVSTRPLLGNEHRQMLEVESGVDPGVTKERGCRTITSRAELSGFLKYQRRAPALYIPIFSPDGETTSAQLRPNNPRVRDGKPIKYETPGGSEIILDVHPRNMAAIKDASRRLWATEGIKKGDALTSRGECAISLSGVWNWGKDGELLRCWEHVALEGREVFAVFDSDVMLKENVQLALERLVAALEPRGATVKVIYLSNAGDNSKVGVDDYLAAGGTVEELVDLAQPYNPSEFTRIRLSRDERLRLLVKDLWSTWRAMPTVKQGELTRRSVMRCLIRAGENSGKPVEDGLRVTVSSRTIALQASIGQPAVSKAIAVLECDGLLRRERGDRDKASAYVLLAQGRAFRNHNRERESQRDHGVAVSPIPSHNDSEMRGGTNSRVCSTSDVTDSEMRGPIDEVPELRWSTVRRARERDKLGRDTTVYDYIARLGKKRGALVEYLVEAGGSATVAELMEGFAGKRTRSRDFKSRTLTPLTDPAVIQIEGDVVTLTQDWLAAVEQHRELAGEPEAERQQAVRVFLDRVAFKNRDNLPEPEPVPEPPKVDDLRKPWPQHPEPCDCRECSSRWGRVIGSHHVDCSCKECYYGRRNGQPPLAPKWIEVVDDLPAEDWREHTLDCECQECMYVMPSYALPCRDSAIKEGR